MAEEILKLKGKDVDVFLKYDAKELSKEDKARNKRSHNYYLKHCKC